MAASPSRLRRPLIRLPAPSPTRGEGRQRQGRASSSLPLEGRVAAAGWGWPRTPSWRKEPPPRPPRKGEGASGLNECWIMLMQDALEWAACAARPPHPPLRGDLFPQGEVKRRQGRAASLPLPWGERSGFAKRRPGEGALPRPLCLRPTPRKGEGASGWSPAFGNEERQVKVMQRRLEAR
jgi:hypothetical protein